MGFARSPLGGTAGVDCQLGKLLSPALCRPDAIDATLETQEDPPGDPGEGEADAQEAEDHRRLSGLDQRGLVGQRRQLVAGLRT